MLRRTFQDLTQWPVFPWVIHDFTSHNLDLSDPLSFRDLSQPVGALNRHRLHQVFWPRFLELEQAGERPFLYGTHYSSPAYVLYYLVRVAPAHALRLQSGKFDEPERLFHSISETHHSVLSAQMDVKELIPEFFGGPPDFLVNKHQLPLGTRQDGTILDDVVLPPWAETPEEFIEKHMTALESHHVSQSIHNWSAFKPFPNLLLLLPLPGRQTIGDLRHHSRLDLWLQAARTSSTGEQQCLLPFDI